jgi:hypothetical protein
MDNIRHHQINQALAALIFPDHLGSPGSTSNLEPIILMI